ncbi:MAG: hypothetical protein QXD03_02615 [Candidatus Anstonellales archaeon]
MSIGYTQLFVPAIQVFDIIKFKVLSKHSKEEGNIEGDKDVYVEDIVGNKGYITRSELVNRYRLLNGKKIRLWVLNSDTDYIGISRCNKECNTVYIKQGNDGYYIVRYGDGVIGKVAKGIFKKAFMVMPSDELNAVLNVAKSEIGGKCNIGKVNLSNTINKDNSVKVKESKLERILNEGVNLNNNVEGCSYCDKNKQYNVEGKSEIINGYDNSLRKLDNSPKIKFKVVARVVGRGDKVVGYIVVSNKGRKMYIEKVDLAKLCNNKLVENVEIVNRDGKKFFRGNGIRLEDLPKVRVDKLKLQ